MALSEAAVKGVLVRHPVQQVWSAQAPLQQSLLATHASPSGPQAQAPEVQIPPQQSAGRLHPAPLGRQEQIPPASQTPLQQSASVPQPLPPTEQSQVPPEGPPTPPTSSQVPAQQVAEAQLSEPRAQELPELPDVLALPDVELVEIPVPEAVPAVVELPEEALAPVVLVEAEAPLVAPVEVVGLEGHPDPSSAITARAAVRIAGGPSHGAGPVGKRLGVGGFL